MPAVFVFALAVTLAGCAAAPTASSSFAQGRSEPRDLEKLASLREQRSLDAGGSDFPIGPGDVIEITVPGLVELESRTVRLSGAGTLSLPILGTVQAAGLTEGELTDEIRRRLEESVMYDPPVNVFVREYRSRLVGVVGAVEKPGLYALSSYRDTLLDALALAGGRNKRAGTFLELMPAALRGDAEAEVALASSHAARLPAQPPIGDAITVDLSLLINGGFVGLRARPGDVILVPDRGEVLVKGWVHKPGSYPISQGLTVLGAVTAAGGTRFAAKSGSVRVMRATEDGSRVFLDVDLKKVQSGKQADLPVTAGDVVGVGYTLPKVIVSGFYEFLATIFNIGFSVF